MKGYMEEIRSAAESDLYTFARLINPERLYGEIHKSVFKFLERTDTPNQLLLLPRGHMKSHMIAVWCAWWLTKNPETTIMYLSATSDLAEKQLFAIKQMIDSKIYRLYWPEMTHPEEGKRTKWSASEIIVDHPNRIREGVRDPSIRAAGLTTTTTGSHADVIVPDDVVVPDNAYTEEGRRKVASAMSQMASILNTGGMIKACGTRYHARDQYNTWMEQKLAVYDDNDEICGEEPIWELFEGVVEENGLFIWPREVRADGKAFGFNRKELARIKALYTDQTQFYAQYYNNPNDPSSNRIDSSKFQYFDQRMVRQSGGAWYYKDKYLNIYACIDFAYSLNKRADYTAIVVIGIDSDGFIYVLDIDRFRGDKISVYFEHLAAVHSKWGFRKLRAEVNAAQSIICNDLKDRIRQEGMNISIDEHRPSRHNGTKEERINAVLEHRYASLTVYHSRGGYTPAMEEELMLARPPHDDIIDSLAGAIEIARPPSNRWKAGGDSNIVPISSRFGGVAF